MSGSMMGVRPDIALGVAGGPGGPPLPGTNMLGALALPMNLMNTQSEIHLRNQEIANQQQQLQMLQQQFGARQQAGQIISASPDLDSAIGNLSRNQNVMGYYPESMANIRQLQTQVQALRNARAQEGQIQATTQAEQTRSGLNVAETGRAQAGTAEIGTQIGKNAYELANRAIAGTVDSPDQLLPTLKTALGALPPGVRQTYAPMFDSLGKSLITGLPDDPGQARDIYNKRLLATVAGSGAPITGMLEGMPKAITTTVAGQPMGGVQGPGFMGGGQVLQPATIAPGQGAVPGGTPTTVGGLQTGAAYAESRGKDMADYQKNLDERVTMGANVMQTLEQAREAMQSFKPGGGADAYARIGQVAQALGADNKLVDRISNGDLGASQEFTKLMVNTAMGQIREQIPSGSRLSQLEFKAFNDNNPNISTDPRAIEKIFNFWTKLYGRDTMEQKELNRFPGPISQWPAAWQQMAQERGIINPQITQGGAPQGGAKPDSRWNPTSRKLEPMSP